MAPKHTNNLIKETSPYLLQHAHNPVNWEAWSQTALDQAKSEGKLLLISIGYAACHWCHVMEHECFEDEEVASVMNTNFVNIKIDREERPDIDQIYMDALQMMTGSGGWPLNIVALPDGRPFWGATYVKKQDWIKVLGDLFQLYKTSPERVLEYADNMAQGIIHINSIINNTDKNNYDLDTLKKDVHKWSNYFDFYLGGYKRAPKFPMPVNLNFLLHYATSLNDDNILEYVHTTLKRMAFGGIFDHVGGGFSRYAVDTKWHVPHFEKMLYDNGQLISLYSKAYAASGDELYKEIVEKNIAFITNELMTEDKAFYSSLDADSLNEKGELEEGAFYVWKKQDLISILGADYSVFEDYFNINSYGHWEEENYVLIRDTNEVEILEKHDITKEQLKTKINHCFKVLKKTRNYRNRPRLDDKILTSWNGLMLKGLVDAYKHLQNDSYLNLAIENAGFILQHLRQKDGSLFHNYKNGKSTINGYLEDYASVIDAFIGLYQISCDESWLEIALELMEYCLANFLNLENGLFYFTSKKDQFLIRRTIEVEDNVIPSSNSIMAHNLFKLSKFYPEKEYDHIYQRMLKNVEQNFSKNIQSQANWLDLFLCQELQFYEVAVVGEHFKEKVMDLQKHYLPNAVFAGTQKQGGLSLLKNRYHPQQTLIFICEHGACQLPLTHSKEALTRLQ
ncbi:thioredoxin domain-containing protein [Maribacter litopenaei]|uniref:Thioredoxin domain-containing protein n=1 Tax=Maribacter litopenaei TaxID=2976127 RepID=A0ABY5Y8Z1_9FLAO|nr:thioredoxin domain-containing protein [Maribacter litopenaei]UWX55510.1 thioredoxin domain-containing protein [Maribacter litopenaei]